MSSRKLATVETVTAIRAIPDADAIECARIRGWDVVVKKGEFAAGERCLYLEVDTLIDVTDPRFAFLAPRGTRTDMDGNTGHVLKTARLRGQYSQGLALPLTDFPEITGPDGLTLPAGADVTGLLPVTLWTPPLPANLTGHAYGRIPGWIPVTDEDRLENNPHLLTAREHIWTATEKLDGTSTTVYVNPHAGDTTDLTPSHWRGIRGVCSRNYDLAYDPEQTQWRLALDADLHTRMADTWPGQQAVLQGETIGESIQGNPLRVTGQRLVLFTVRVAGRELPRAEWPDWVLQQAVPTYPDLEFPSTVDDAVIQVDGLTSRYTPGQPAEGVVWRADTATVRGGDTPDSVWTARGSFKVISRRYLLKHDR
jgi:RNA ligase (TIGR02306 family)